MNFNRETVQKEDADFELIELLFRQLTYTGRTKLISTIAVISGLDQMSPPAKIRLCLFEDTRFVLSSTYIFGLLSPSLH